MSLIRFSDKLMAKSPVESFKFIESGLVENFVTYITNSQFRKAVNLRSWIKKQVQPTNTVLSKCDEAVIDSLKLVISQVRYKPDQAEWRMPEYWQTAGETVDLGTGDCEDGAVLLYVICRHSGVPAERLLLFAGDVQDPLDKNNVVGHCALFYRPDNYPLNFAILDWCYYEDKRPINDRHLYTVFDQYVFGYSAASPNKVIDKRYVKGWFWFNESKSTLSLRSE